MKSYHFRKSSLSIINWIVNFGKMCHRTWHSPYVCQAYHYIWTIVMKQAKGMSEYLSVKLSEVDSIINGTHLEHQSHQIPPLDFFTETRSQKKRQENSCTIAIERIYTIFCGVIDSSVMIWNRASKERLSCGQLWHYFSSKFATKREKRKKRTNNSKTSSCKLRMRFFYHYFIEMLSAAEGKILHIYARKIEANDTIWQWIRQQMVLNWRKPKQTMRKSETQQ